MSRGLTKNHMISCYVIFLRWHWPTSLWILPVFTVNSHWSCKCGLFLAALCQRGHVSTSRNESRPWCDNVMKHSVAQLSIVKHLLMYINFKLSWLFWDFFVLVQTDPCEGRPVESCGWHSLLLGVSLRCWEKGLCIHGKWSLVSNCGERVS